jgi:hypothetical protein
VANGLAARRHDSSAAGLKWKGTRAPAPSDRYGFLKIGVLISSRAFCALSTLARVDCSIPRVMESRAALCGIVGAVSPASSADEESSAGCALITLSRRATVFVDAGAGALRGCSVTGGAA